MYTRGNRQAIALQRRDGNFKRCNGSVGVSCTVDNPRPTRPRCRGRVHRESVWRPLYCITGIGRGLDGQSVAAGGKQKRKATHSRESSGTRGQESFSSKNCGKTLGAHNRRKSGDVDRYFDLGGGGAVFQDIGRDAHLGECATSEREKKERYVSYAHTTRRPEREPPVRPIERP